MFFFNIKFYNALTKKIWKKHRINSNLVALNKTKPNMAQSKVNTQYKIFVVEDNTLYAQVLKKQLVEDGYSVKVFHNGRDFMASLDEKPDVVTLDYTLPDMTGYDVLKKIQRRMPGTTVIIISAQENINTAIDLMKNGAYDYITKAPDTREKLSNIIKNIREADQLRTENQLLKDAVKEKYNFRSLIKGNSREIDHIFDLMDKAVQTQISVS
ncbi:MAG TPA: hypothetical protein DER09_06305, partial [Prolixibacteraceae bacterium]|nr:hypothetical protein [Prolixibacteraceae bacterium]